MESELSEPAYHIWGADNAVYGPIKAPDLIDWIKEERVTADTWVYVAHKGFWAKASDLPELSLAFSSAAKDAASVGSDDACAVEAKTGLRPGTLRRIKILGGMDDHQLATLIEYMEMQHFKQFAHVVRFGEHGDAMYLILEGELRARVIIDGKESTLSTLAVGDFFGEISLLDEGPRSADVIANEDSVVLKISMGSFHKLMSTAPELALHFLYTFGRSAAGRMRVLSKRYQDSIHFSRTALGQ